MNFPLVRLRRNRKAEWSRDMVAETDINARHLIQPIFIVEGSKIKEEIKTLPDVYRYSIDEAVKFAKECETLGIAMIALFPVVDSKKKSEDAKEALNAKNLICEAIKTIKLSCKNIGIMADVALDPYTTSGHDGVLDKDGYVDNDATVSILVGQALNLAAAGADAVAPSDMMDGRVQEIRQAFEENGYFNTQIISYTAKYASAFYGPFRDAIKTKQKGGKYLDKSTYQMDHRNVNEAVLEAEHDINEGADMLIVKPASLYLDVIRALDETYNVPIIAYHVSGEYAALKFAAMNGALDFDKAMMESLIALRRAGAKAIITYAAADILRSLQH